MTECVILIPGIMGSELIWNGQVIWPGNPLELALPYKHMAELLSPDLVVGDIIRKFSISSQYSDLLRILEASGYREHAAKPTLKVLPYDWRKDNALAVKQLADCVDALLVVHGSAEVNLIAHSMGGLIARSYLESTVYASRPGFSSVRRLISMGTPHLGSPMALSAALGYEKRLFLSAAQVKQLANWAGFPAVYQLLPPRGLPFVWDRSVGSRLKPIDVYDTTVAEHLGLNGGNLDAALEFHGTIDFSRRPKSVQYFSFVGNHLTTTSGIELTITEGVFSRPQKDIAEFGGDGTVPIWSASQPGMQNEPVGGEHGEIYKTALVQRLVEILVGRKGVALASADVAEIWLSDKVVEVGSETAITVQLPRHTQSIEAELRLRRVNVDGAVAAIPASRFGISYKGPDIDHVTVLIVVPVSAAAYMVEYVPSGANLAEATAELFVQET